MERAGTDGPSWAGGYHVVVSSRLMPGARPPRKARARHLVLAGLNYSPRRGTGDKNFWSALVPRIADEIDRITIVSVRDEETRREVARIDGCEIEVRYVAPAVLRAPGPGELRRRPIGWRRGSYPRLLGFLDKQLLVRRVANEIAGILEPGGEATVHLMDNFGPANRWIARLADRHAARMGVTALGYDRRGGPLYDQFIRLSYVMPRLRLVPVSRRLERRLSELGVRAQAMTRIPWGVVPGLATTDVERCAARSALGLSTQRPLFMWAGFIQQIREPDFRLALGVAKEALRRGLDATFAFAFKPETFRPEYAALHQPEAGIHVLATHVDAFTALRGATDALFSPIASRDCIVAPPLTWIELMAMGRPVLSTDVPGADELVEHGRTGYLAHNDEELVAGLFSLRDASSAMADACRAKVADEYNLEDIGRRYVHFWFEEAV